MQSKIFFPEQPTVKQEIIIEIETESCFWDCLYTERLGRNNGKVILNKQTDFISDLKILEGFGSILQQLNHEILHVIIARLEGWWVTCQFDDLRNKFPNLSRENIPFF